MTYVQLVWHRVSFVFRAVSSHVRNKKQSRANGFMKRWLRSTGHENAWEEYEASAGRIKLFPKRTRGRTTALLTIVSTTKAGALQRAADDEGRKKKAHARLLDYDRDACLAPRSHAQGWGGNCSIGEPRRTGGSVNRRNVRSALTFTCTGLGGCYSDGAPTRKGAPDGREARSGPTIVMRETWGVLQRQRGMEEEGAHAVAGL